MGLDTDRRKGKAGIKAAASLPVTITICSSFSSTELISKMFGMPQHLQVVWFPAQSDAHCQGS